MLLTRCVASATIGSADAHPGSLHSRSMRDRALYAYLTLAGIFLGALVLCNLIVLKFFGFQWPDWVPFLGGELAILSVGILPYPLTFLCTDLLSEVYGKKRADAVVWVGLLVSLLTLMWIQLGISVPAHETSPVDDDMFRLIFGNSMRAIMASMIAYLFAQWVDIRIFHFWKKLTNGKHLWFRNNASTILSQLLDSTLVITVLFAGIWSNTMIISAIVSAWVFKILCAIADTPLMYLGVWAFRRFDLAPNPVTATVIEERSC